jgi:hypothetical protein
VTELTSGICSILQNKKMTKTDKHTQRFTNFYIFGCSLQLQHRQPTQVTDAGHAEVGIQRLQAAT